MSPKRDAGQAKGNHKTCAPGHSWKDSFDSERKLIRMPVMKFNTFLERWWSRGEYQADEQAGVDWSAGEYHADEQAGVARLSWRVSDRKSTRLNSSHIL